MKKTVSIRLEGGCGNQLFQFFAALGYANSLNSKLIIDLSNVLQNRHRGYNISSISYLHELTEVEFVDSTPPPRIQRRIEILLGTRFVSDGIGLPKNAPNLTKLRDIEGYFQSFLYFDQVTSDSSFDLNALKLSLKALRQDSLIEVENIERSTILHIRGGDYRNLLNTVGKLSAPYYFNSLNKIEGSRENIFVISDDSEAEIASMFGDMFEYRYVDTKNTHPLGLISFMSEFESLVISNSTLSWWGGKIQGSDRVVAPSKWFRGISEPMELLPPNWLRQDSIWQD